MGSVLWFSFSLLCPDGRLRKNHASSLLAIARDPSLEQVQEKYWGRPANPGSPGKQQLNRVEGEERPLCLTVWNCKKTRHHTVTEFGRGILTVQPHNASEASLVTATFAVSAIYSCGQCVWLPVKGFLLVFCSNHSDKMHHWARGMRQTERQTDRHIDISQWPGHKSIMIWINVVHLPTECRRRELRRRTWGCWSDTCTGPSRHRS